MRRLLVAVSLSACLAGCGPDEAPPAPDGAPAGAKREREASAPLPQPLPEPGAAAGAHLLLVTLDTTRADRLGCYGAADAATPSLDRLAARGLRFTDAVSPVPMTLPAHASLMTGLDPPGHGVRVNGVAPLGPEHTTLAEALAGAGYRTAAFVSSFVLDPRFGLDQGFETYDATLEATRAAAFEPQTERSATSVTEAALGWLAARGEEDAPFFLWVHYFDPHDPYQPPEPFAGRFRERPYDGEIAYVDSELGRLLAAVPPETLVVVAGDHGESLGEHGERYHSRSLYEGAVRVPLIVALPGSGAEDRAGEGGAVGGFVATLGDLYPTLLDLLAIEGAGGDGLDGRSLVREPVDAGRAVYLETLNPWVDNGWAPLYAARSHDRKYVLAPTPELYDLAADPAESRNLLAGGGEPGEARAEAEALRELLDRRLPGGPLADLLAGGEEGAGGTDPEIRRRLEALGYLGAGSSGGGDRSAPYEELPDPKEMLPLLDVLAEGRRHLASGRPEEAERSARRVLAASPRDRSALQLLAESYATRGREEDAERVLRRSLEIGPTLGACVLLAQVVLQRGGPDRSARADEAEALLDLAAETDPRHGAVLLARGDLALVRGRPEEALARYEEAAEADPYRFAGLARVRIERIRSLGRQ